MYNSMSFITSIQFSPSDRRLDSIVAEAREEEAPTTFPDSSLIEEATFPDNSLIEGATFPDSSLIEGATFPDSSLIEG